MRIIILLVGLVIALSWLGVEVRNKHKPASNVLFAFALLFLVLLVGAIYDLL
jgi:putative exporter of polyketide antibiotics